MPESSPIATQVNPYQPPESPIVGNGAVTFLPGRIFFALLVSTSALLFAILFHSTVSVAVTLTIVSGAAIALGFMPRGYGKYDWVLGLWIILLGVAFGLTEWWRKLDGIHPLDRGNSFLMHLAFFGLLPGLVASLPFTAARIFAKWVFEAHSLRTILISEDPGADAKPDSSHGLSSSGIRPENGITKSG
jgi:hypothetical protein